MRARRKSERVNGSRAVDQPPVERVASTFGATGVNRIADALLEQLIARRCGAARQSFVVDVQLSAGVGSEKMIRRPRHPLNESDLRVVDEPLKQSRQTSCHKVASNVEVNDTARKPEKGPSKHDVSTRQARLFKRHEFRDIVMTAKWDL